MEEKILEGCPELEIYNSRFTCNFGEWALGFCGGLYDKENPGSANQNDDRPLQEITSLDLSNRCIHNLIKKVWAPTLYLCLVFYSSMLMIIENIEFSKRAYVKYVKVMIMYRFY